MKTVSECEVNYIDHMGNDLSVVNAARVSFNKMKTVFDNSDKKLVEYLAKHKHYSPFNHTFITMKIKAPIFVARQLVKHEYMPWNEVSRRYVDDEPEFFFPEDWRSRPSDGIKQGSGDVHDKSYFMKLYCDDTTRHGYDTYKHFIKQGVAPEQARMVLPQNTMTEWYWSGTLKAWSKMYNLRIDSHSQVETREVAVKVDKVISPLFPVAWGALKEYAQ